MKVLFVINTKSGTQSDINLEALIDKQVEQTGIEKLIYYMQGDDEQNIKAAIASFKPNCMAVAGGDGTVNMAARILAHTAVTLLIIPSGSANGMAKELSIFRVEQAISLLSTGALRQIDMISINGIPSIHLADVGLNARVVKRFEEDRRRGILTYARHLFGEIFLMKHYRFYIIYDGKQIKRKAVSLTFANATRYGTGAVINPAGVLDDGQFELIIVKPFPNIKLPSIAWKMFRNKLHTSDYVEILCCKEAFIRCSKRTTLQVDGEIIGKTKEFRVEVMRRALTLLVPE